MAFIVDSVHYEFAEEIVSRKTANRTHTSDAKLFEPRKQYDLDEDSGEISIKESTELGESLKELNNDDIEKVSRMSGIDMRSRLHFTEISSILAVDTLVAFKCLPVSCLAFTRQKKRLAVSLKGEGRKEIVGLVSGKKDQDAKVSGGSLWDKFTGGKKNEI